MTKCEACRNVYKDPYAPGAMSPSLISKAKAGFSIEEMGALVEERPACGAHRAKGLYWDTEGYSQGDLIRASVGWPIWLPIPVSGDHGARSTLSLWRGVQVGARHYLTTDFLKAHLVRRPNWLRVRLVRSPWQVWIERSGASLDNAAEGTLAFVPHLAPGAQHTETFVREYARELLALPDEYQPVVACVHKHDVRSGLPGLLMKHGLPVVTAGNTSHPLFFARWVDLVRTFRFATSPSPGSDLILFHALGGTYFVYGPPFNFSGRIKSDDAAQAIATDLESLLDGALAGLQHDLFAYPPDASLRPAQDAFLSLFLTAGDRLTEAQLRIVMLRAMLSVSPRYLWKWALHRVKHSTLGAFVRRGVAGISRRIALVRGLRTR